ncbi:xanthine dehydrogenase family protein molybdopterin-binding subunit [Kovacikia minuta]|uniref:xanthine dehydrogenase family protein molybdopterin-binding subunit n=1 Tax=Kovacikia minuta TaxID=2931930 RepID=UPI0020C77F69
MPTSTLVTADTHQTPFDAGSYASATLCISGQATKLAAEKLRTQLLDFAAPLLEVSPEELTIAHGMIRSAHQSISLPELVQAVMGSQEPGVRNQEVSGEGDGGDRGDTETRKHGDAEISIQNSKFKIQNSNQTQNHPPLPTPQSLLPLLEAESAYVAPESPLTFMVQGVEVEVDTETGKVTVLRSVQAIDLGKAINPQICLGQAAGGSVMGLGYALLEEQIGDDHGKILNPNFRAYRIPTAADIPPIEIFLIETNDPYGPFGAKGVGEIAINGMAPAIANAIAHATGVSLTQLPMTPERVWRGMREEF